MREIGSWDVREGETLEVLASGDEAWLRYAAAAVPDAAVLIPVDPGTAIEMTVAVHEACGKPAPVITLRPEIDPRLDYRFGPLTVRPARGGSVPVEMGAVTEGFAPHAARRLAGVLVARADEADGQDPAATLADRIGALMSLGLPLDVIAVRLIADGWSRTALPGEADGNG